MRYVEKEYTDPLVQEAQTLLRLSRHYNSDDRVKDIIRIIYSGCCAFCGSSPEASSYYQIEHFYPKALPAYRRWAKDIRNLHYSCQRCNNLKSTPLHSDLFSPNYFLQGRNWMHCSPKKFDDELAYIGHLLYSFNKPGTPDRGQYTIKLFDLNNQHNDGRSGRRSLVEARIRMFDNVFQLMLVLFDLINSYEPRLQRPIELLFLSAIKYFNPESAYSSMVLDNFGDSVTKLLDVYLKKRRALP